MSWDLGAGNQAFADGIMMKRSPMAESSRHAFDPTQATMDSGSNATHIEDSALPGANDYWNGATVWTISGKEWISMTSTVTDYDASTHTLAFNPLKSTGNANYDPKSGNTYVLSGIKAALDTEREWWYDSANSMIYLWAPGGGDPTGQTIEAKKRSVAIDLSGLSYVTIDGIHTFAATIITDIDTAYCNLQGLVSEFVSHNKLNTIAAEQSNFGILINGSHNVLRDSEIVYSSGSLVTVEWLR